MSTTSRSHARRTAAALTGAVILALAAPAAEAQRSLRSTESFRPGAPLPALTAPARPRTIGSATERGPVELESVRVGATSREERLASLAPLGFFERASRPLVIEVVTAAPLDPTPRGSLPVIVLNGERLLETRIVPDDGNRLVAFLADREGLQQRNEVRVVWLGDEQLTASRKPIFFTLRDVERDATVSHP